MIEFACKKIRQKEVIRCSFGLNKTEYDILRFLLENEGKRTVSQIAEKINLDRTTVQKAVQGLLGKDLVSRTKKGLSDGGYTFLYETESKQKIKNQMIKKIRKWSEAVKNEIKAF